MNIEDEELEQYTEHVNKYIQAYNSIDLLPEPGLPVKYLSSPGYLPSQKDNPYNAWVRITDTKGSPTGKLSGKTVAVKDNVAVAGVPMTISSQFMSGYVPPYHATVVSRLLEAGAFLKGKVAAESMCFSGSSFTSHPVPVLNPHDKERSAGGSSSGSAVIVAVGDVDLAIGTDTGGSIRLPASWCGIVGLKPTHGLVPHTGIFPLDRFMDHNGPMARTVKDCALMLEVIAGYDNGLDPAQPVNLTVPNYSELLSGNISGKRVALIKEGFDGSEPDVAETVVKAAKSLESLGATVEEISFPAHIDIGDPAIVLLCEGSYDAFVNGGLTPLNSRGYKDTFAHDFHFNARKAKADQLPFSKKNLILGTAFVREKFGCHFYSKAVNIIRSFVAEYDRLFEKYDALVMPTIKFKAPKLPKAETPVGDLLNQHLTMAKNTEPYNATGHPALSINAGFSEGLPVGMMIVGRHFEDATVLNVAHAFENIRDAKK